MVFLYGVYCASLQNKTFLPEFSIFILISSSVANERDMREGLEEGERRKKTRKKKRREKTQNWVAAPLTTYYITIPLN